MDIVGGIGRMLAAPLVEAYGEWRKWQIIEKAGDRVMNGAAPHANDICTRLQNGANALLTKTGEYTRLTVGTCGSGAITYVVYTIKSAGACHVQNDLSCLIANLGATLTMLYTVFGATVLIVKLTMDSKGPSREPAQVEPVNERAVDRNPEPPRNRARSRREVVPNVQPAHARAVHGTIQDLNRGAEGAFMTLTDSSEWELSSFRGFNPTSLSWGPQDGVRIVKNVSWLSFFTHKYRIFNDRTGSDTEANLLEENGNNYKALLKA